MEVSSKIKIIGNYTILTREGVEYGIFLRSPVQNIYFDVYGCSENRVITLEDYHKRMQSKFWVFWENLKGNREVTRNYNKWMGQVDFAGFRARMFVFPIYFKRNFRELICIGNDSCKNIKKIYSYGYEGIENFCSGDCHREKTIITLADGTKLKETAKGSYNYTYRHIVKEIIMDGGNKK